jgi:hypothetical protein
MAVVADSAPTPNCFPSKTSNPTIHQTTLNAEQLALLDAREVYVEAAGYTVDRTTGVVTVT